MTAPVRHILPLVAIKRTRRLENPGVVKVRSGQTVIATDIIAEAPGSGKHIIVDLKRALGIQKGSIADYIGDRKAGDKLQKGDIIAQVGGLFKRVVRAPSDCQIVAFGSSQVMLVEPTSSHELRAGYSGTITDVLPEHGAIIESTGSLVQGVWGNGKINQGLLITAIKQPDEELTTARLDVSYRGAIVLAGACLKTEVLKAASDLQLRGLILSSMAADLQPLASSLGFPLVILEGFGHLPMNPLSYDLLTNSENRDVSLNAAYNISLNGEVPEIFISLPAGAENARETTEFAAGQTVLIHGGPYQSKIGKIIKVRSGHCTLKNGLRTKAAEVQIESEQNTILVPITNLDVIE